MTGAISGVGAGVNQGGGAFGNVIPMGAGLRAERTPQEILDMVLAVGWLKSGHHSYVAHDIGAVVNACQGQAIVKVILETCLLDEAEKRLAGADNADGHAFLVSEPMGDVGRQGREQRRPPEEARLSSATGGP